MVGQDRQDPLEPLGWAKAGSGECTIMTEMPKAEEQMAMGKPRRDRWYLFQMACPFLLLAYLPVPSKLDWRAWVPCVLCLEVPIILLAVRARNRWFHPDRLPARWPKDYPLERRLDLLSAGLYLGVVGYFVSSLLIGHEHEILRVTVESFFMTAYLSGVVLDRCVVDRKYIEPYKEPTEGWSGMVGRLHSDHWGGRKPVAESGQP
jgi:hypothetical protein